MVWNVRSTIGTIWNSPQGYWNAAGQLERAQHHWNSPQGNWNVRSTIGTREAHNFSAEREVDAGNR